MISAPPTWFLVICATDMLLIYMKPFWGHIGQRHNSNMSKKRLCFLSFIKSSLLTCGIFQDRDNMFTQCTIVYYYIYLHTDNMKYREEAEEKRKKHMIGEIPIFKIEHTSGMR